MVITPLYNTKYVLSKKSIGSVSRIYQKEKFKKKKNSKDQNVYFMLYFFEFDELVKHENKIWAITLIVLSKYAWVNTNLRKSFGKPQNLIIIII